MGPAINVPQEAILACRTVSEVGRLLWLKFIATAEPGTLIDGNLDGVDKFLEAQAMEWLTQ